MENCCYYCSASMIINRTCYEPLSSILLVSRSKAIVFSSAMGDLYSYFHFWYGDKKITNSNTYFNQKWMRGTTFLLFHLVFCSLIFKMSNQWSQKRERRLGKQALPLMYGNTILGGQEVSGWTALENVLHHVDPHSLPYTTFCFFFYNSSWRFNWAWP